MAMLSIVVGVRSMRNAGKYVCLTTDVALNGQMGILFGIRDCGADRALGRNSGLGQRIVTRVEIFTILVRNSQANGCIYGIGGNSSYLLHLHKHALVRWKLAILSKKLLLLRVQLLQKAMMMLP